MRRSQSLCSMAAVAASPLLAVLLTFISACAISTRAQNPQLERRGAQAGGAHVVLSARRLSPPLRAGNRRVSFSPDGRYLLAQDDSGVTLFTRAPLAKKFHIDVDDAVSAAFTADSQNVVIASNSLRYEIVSVAGSGSGESKQFSSQATACATAKLSASGNVFACLDSGDTMHIFDVASGAEMQIAHKTEVSHFFGGFEQLSTHSPFSEPFGAVESFVKHAATSSEGFANRLLVSPDGHLVLWQPSGEELEGYDAVQHAAFRVPGTLKNRGIYELEFVAPDVVSMLDWTNRKESQLVDITSGKTIRKLPIAGVLRRCSSPRYAIRTPFDEHKASLLDLSSGQLLPDAVEEGSDVRGEEVATYTADGQLEVASLSTATATPPSKIAVTAGWISKIRAAIATPDLGAFAIGAGEGAVYDATTGRRIASVDNADGAWCSGSGACYLRVASKKLAGFDVQKTDLATGNLSTAWSQPAASSSRGVPDLTALRLRTMESSGGVLLLHDADIGIEREFGNGIVIRSPNPKSTDAVVALPFNLVARAIESGAELWKRKFSEEPPIPFSDPQGDRIVLGWSAASAGGRSAAKENPVAAKALKTDKKTTHDVYFEVLEARTGKTVGGVLVPSNAPADTFDEAFSEGDWLVLARDGQRVIVESLSTGQEVLRLRGWWPVINAASALLAVSSEEARVDVYDLKSGEKLKDYRFPAPVAYTQFSADGSRMLAITRDQQAFVLDMSHVRGAAPSAQDQ